LDRFDLVVPISRPDPEELLSGCTGETSDAAAGRVAAARTRAQERGEEEPAVAPDGTELLAAKLRDGTLSARGLQKVTRVARTIADLEGEDVVSFVHVAEALSLRAGRAAVAV
jgi:magnesium chelatase family protein